MDVVGLKKKTSCSTGAKVNEISAEGTINKFIYALIYMYNYYKLKGTNFSH